MFNVIMSSSHPSSPRHMLVVGEQLLPGRLLQNFPIMTTTHKPTGFQNVTSCCKCVCETKCRSPIAGARSSLTTVQRTSLNFFCFKGGVSWWIDENMKHAWHLVWCLRMNLPETEVLLTGHAVWSMGNWERNDAKRQASKQQRCTSLL